LTLVALATVPILVWGIRGFSARMGRLAGEAQSADAGIATSVQQLLAALPLVQSFTRERSEAERFQQRTERSLATRWSQHRTEVLYLAVVAGILAAGTAAIAWTGATEVAAGRLAVGHLLVFLAYLGQLYEPLNQLSNVGATVSVARAGTGRVLEFLDAAAGGPAEGTLDSSRVAAPPEIRFERVTAGYREGNPVLRQFDLTIPAGETVAIVGPSGAGKTTLLSLVSRFLDPDSGRVMLGGVDVRELRLEALRGLVAWVPQEPILLPGTVAENIGFGRAGASSEEIVSAARAAHADEFIQRLPSGYDTQVGDGAARLSSGEKQRLNLARAFLKRAPVLLLDEPTSALDSESEALILESLRAWSKGRTVMMVAHRLRTLSVAHRIVVVRDGTLLEQGTREDLVARGGYFATVLENG
jgi:ATP-binding cassette subfamily B protein/subfamily B ATP-binding cassette protein MsbA